MRSQSNLPYSRFALVMAAGAPAPDTQHGILTPGAVVGTRAGAVTATIEDVGRYIDIGTGAVVAQSVVDWFCDAWKSFESSHPDWTPEQIERAIDGAQAPEPMTVSQYGSGVSITRYNGTTTVIAPNVPDSHRTIATKINTGERLLSAITHLLEDLKTAGVRVDHWAITEIKLLARRV